jgi:hypothetical protein
MLSSAKAAGNAVGPGCGQVVRGCRQRVRGPDQAPGRVSEDLHVHPMVLLLPCVVRPVGGNTVDWQHGAVEDHVRLLPHGRHRLLERGGGSGQKVDSLAHVVVDRRDPDTEARGEAAAQVGASEQGLPTTGQATPAGADPAAVTSEKTG